jgi:hypothetical protein
VRAARTRRERARDAHRRYKIIQLGELVFCVDAAAIYMHHVCARIGYM